MPVLLLLGATGAAQAQATIWVDGANTCPGTGSQADPFCAIQTAYTAALDGDEVRVLPGVYNECVIAFDGGSQKGVRIVADAFNPSVPSTASMTTITGNGLSCFLPPPNDTVLTGVVSLGGFGSSLEGFTVTGGQSSGIFAVGPVTITGNIIDSNDSDLGGGLFLYPSPCFYGNVSMLVEDNEITNNTASASTDPITMELINGEGGGVYIDGIIEDDPGCPSTGTIDVLFQNNLVDGNTADASGGGILAFTLSEFGNVDAQITITNSTIDNNDAALATFGLGGGIYASTYGYGNETVEISNNLIRGNSSVDDGGGISAWVRTLQIADAAMVVDNNSITGNQSGGSGGGVDTFLELLDLQGAESATVTVSNNTISGNMTDSTFAGGGGMLAYVLSERSDATNTGITIQDNDIIQNTSQEIGGGLSVLAIADADPTNGTGGPGTILPANADVDLLGNKITQNSATGLQLGVGGGVFIYLEAEGDATAEVTMPFNTVAGSTIDDANAVGGIHVESFTYVSTDMAAEGIARFDLNHSIVSENDGAGIGGPVPGSQGIFAPTQSGDGRPNTANLVGTTDYTNVFGHPGGDVDLAVIPVPGPNNQIGVDPLLDAVTFLPDVCSPTLDAGDPLLDFSAEAPPIGTAINLGHTGGTSSSTGSLADPTGDRVVDGLDTVLFSTSFMAPPASARFNVNSDFDGNTMVDGNDLSFLGADFGTVCP